LAILNGVFALAGVLGAVMLLSRGTKSAVTLLPLVLGSLVGFTNAWFMFIVCNRGINKEGFGWKTNLAKDALVVASGGKIRLY
jgi:xanthine/uracil permease